MIVTIPTLPGFKAERDSRGEIKIPAVESNSIYDSLLKRGFMVSMMGGISYEEHRNVWLVHMAED